jgi:hypothetical protein
MKNCFIFMQLYATGRGADPHDLSDADMNFKPLDQPIPLTDSDIVPLELNDLRNQRVYRAVQVQASCD